MEIDQLTAELTKQIGYTPSKYQVGLLEWVLNGKGNGACNAVAGAGKSSTLGMVAITLELMGYKPSDIRVIVFGKENSKDLIAKFGRNWKDSISTLHSCGFRILQREVGRFGPSERVSVQKYKWIAQELGFVASKRNPANQLVREKVIEKPDDLYKMVDLVRLTLSKNNSEDIEQLAAHHNIEGILKPAEVAIAVKEILKVGEQQAIKHVIDYTDQIWLPVKWQLRNSSWFKPYKFVLIDECQNLNAAQLELAIALAGKNGRLLFVGDPRQTIFGFSGADNRSYQKILERTKATELPLSICYRCPTSHVELVRSQFPQIPIEARSNVPIGTITAINESELDQHLKVGDMILSRKTAPLVTRCIKLIAKGIKATVKGRDIGEQIKRDLEEIGRLLGFRYSEFPDFARQYKSLKVQRYQGLDNEEQLIEQLNDKLEALTAIYKARVEATNVAQLSDYIDSLFSDETSPITLSTCHRAKGLEGDRIFILKPEDLPFTWRKQLEWQKEQEDNLLYVALTRSKSELFVVGQPAWLLQEEDKTKTEAIASSPDLQLEFPLELTTQEDEEEVNDYSDWMPELAVEEDLIPDLAEIIKTESDEEQAEIIEQQHTVNISSDSEQVNLLNNSKTINDLQAETEKAISYPSKRWIEPWRIHTDLGTQSRKQTNQRTVDEYAQQMQSGLWDWKREPLPVIFDDGENWYPGDGHHRLIAAVAAEQPRIFIEVRQGSLRDAQFFSCGANCFHGLPRTNADKRNQVKMLLLDSEWQKMSDRAIAQHCGVSAPFVGKIRAELAFSGTVNISTERIDKLGRKIETANIGTKPKKTQTVDALQHEEQLHFATEFPSPLALENKPAEPLTSPPLPQTRALEPKGSHLADQAAFSQAESITRSEKSLVPVTQAKLRIEGKTKEEIDAIAQRLQQIFQVVEESQDYLNRHDPGIRRYLTIMM